MSSANNDQDLLPDQTEGFKVGEKKTIDEYTKLGMHVQFSMLFHDGGRPRFALWFLHGLVEVNSIPQHKCPLMEGHISQARQVGQC